ncbi:hypothetical protein D3C75_1093690 [compost metagenome]
MFHLIETKSSPTTILRIIVGDRDDRVETIAYAGFPFRARRPAGNSHQVRRDIWQDVAKHLLGQL